MSNSGGGNRDIWRQDEEPRDDRTAPAEETTLEWDRPEGSESPSPISTTSPGQVWSEEPAAPASDSRSDEPSPNGRTRVRPSATAKKVRSKRLRLLKVALVLALFTLVADASYSAYGLAARLSQAADSLQSAQDALRAGDISGARLFLRDAAKEGGAAHALTRRPAFTLLRAFPDASYVASIAEAAELASDAGMSGLEAAASLGTDAEEISASLFSGGRIDLKAIAAAQKPISEAARRLRVAEDLLREADEPWLDFIDDQGQTAEKRVADAAASVATADEVLSVLPGMFGANGPRRYLLGFQALGEARATGGLIGFTGTLETKGGKIQLVEVKSILDSIPSELDSPVDAPDWFADSYGPQTALTQPQQVNVSPNFPAVSRVLLEMFETQTGDTYDGMVLMDPVALEYLLPATGPITVDGWDEPITGDNVVDIMLRDSYLSFDNDDQNLFLAEVVNVFWDRITNGRFDAARFAQGLGEATSSQHFRVFSTSPDEAEAMATAKVDGDYARYGPNVQIVFHNNYSANKVDYYLTRDVETRIKLERDSAQVESTITMTNSAPEGPPSLLLGPSKTYSKNDPPGLNRMLLNALLPESAESIEFGSGEDRTDPILYDDEAHPVPWKVVEIPAGEKVVFRLSYRLAEPYEAVDDGIRFAFTQFPQPAVNSDSFTITVDAPPGYGLVTNKNLDGAPRPGFRAQGTLDAPSTIDFRLIQI